MEVEGVYRESKKMLGNERKCCRVGKAGTIGGSM